MSVHDGNYKAAKKALGIPEDEPIFVIRAQDRLAVPVIVRYANFAMNAECAIEFVDGIETVVQEFRNWQADNETKVPD